MLYSGFAGITLLLSLVAVYMGLKFIGRGGWILAWLRGTAGLALIAMAVLLVLIALDMFSYKQVLNDKVLGTISFSRVENQHYKANLTLIHAGTEKEYELYGDQWQVDARLISWTGFFKMMGAKPGYRLDRLSGRYYSLEDEYRKQRSVHQLDGSDYGVDFWSWVNASGNHVPLVDAVYGSATFLPMEEGAFYEISLTSSGLIAKPMNDVAEQAISRWK